MADRPVVDVLLPSRGRPELLARSIKSLLFRASDPDRVGVLVGADDDDPVTGVIAENMDARCYMFERQGYDRLHVYYRGLAVNSVADWLLVWNDDAIMMTDGWDTVLDGLPSRVLVADLLSNHTPMCCFPAVRREAVEAIGGKFCSDNPHVDSFWEQVGRISETIESVPIAVRHEQQGGAHLGNEHGFHDPSHLVELGNCARRLRGIFK